MFAIVANRILHIQTTGSDSLKLVDIYSVKHVWEVVIILSIIMSSQIHNLYLIKLKLNLVLTFYKSFVACIHQ